MIEGLCVVLPPLPRCPAWLLVDEPVHLSAIGWILTMVMSSSCVLLQTDCESQRVWMQ